MTVLIQGGFFKEAASFFEAIPEVAAQSAALAINTTVDRKLLPSAKKEMLAQINFPSGYLDQEDRLGIAKRADANSLEAVVRARDRATSLARFTNGQTPQNSRGRPLNVQVKRGRTVTLKKAFLVTLKNGNIGLAVRLKPGQHLNNKLVTYNEVKLAKDVYLLYGPSVDQVFKGIADEQVDKVAGFAASEFYRQFARLSRNIK